MAEQLSGQELEVAVARIFGWTNCYPDSTDENHRKNILAEVERRGLEERFTKELSAIVAPNWHLEHYTFRLLSAPVADLCLALVAVVTEEANG